MKRRLHRLDTRGESHGTLGDFWAGYSDLLAGLLLIFIFITTLYQIAVRKKEQALHQLTADISRELREWRDAIDALCHNPELEETGVHVDCETGVIELPDQVFFAYGQDTLSELGRERLRVAVPIVLGELRRWPLVWEHLDVIEVRGHADPRARERLRSRYRVNLELSQSRARRVLEFLTADALLEPQHRTDLEHRAVAAGASSTRPPEKCRGVETEECFARMRRVEILLNFDDRKFRKELNRIVDRIRG